MKIIPIDLSKDYTDALIEAVNVLQKGGVVVYPTDVGYAIGANACDYHAVEQVFKIKNCPLSKPLPIIARNIGWAKELVTIPTKLESVLSKIWPGTTTVILPKKRIIPSVVTAGGVTVGIRISNYPLIDKLLGRFGYPLTVTSAKFRDDEEALNVYKIAEFLRENIWKPDLILDVGTLLSSRSSTILDFSKIKPRILKAGPSKPEELMELLRM